MFHFLTGDELELGLRKIFTALKPRGKLFFNTTSIYLHMFKDMHSYYESNKQLGVKWPGQRHFQDLNVPSNIARQTPSFLHLHKLEDLGTVVEEAGFVVDEMFYYDILKPAFYVSDGKGQIAGILSRP